MSEELDNQTHRFENGWFAVADGFVRMKKYSSALDGATTDELREVRDCLNEVIQHLEESDE